MSCRCFAIAGTSHGIADVKVFGQRSRKERKRVSLLPDDNLYQDGSDTERVRMAVNTTKDLPVHSLRCSNNPHCTKHILHYPIADVIDHELITNFIVVKANWIRDDANDTTLVNPAPLQNFRHRGVINALPNDLTGRSFGRRARRPVLRGNEMFPMNYGEGIFKKGACSKARNALVTPLREVVVEVP
ncbi:hypothetical protein EVAR_97829_1 [Eumeta japonica]|uniref:Uncharacterized protein n=1 Tax=Eumeta variegata TaxID=151549 RepID=A0A4C1SLB6_EUMVA|nr:hypothetical protein EVAR_97829_1 [Eumeta japonica]